MNLKITIEEVSTFIHSYPLVFLPSGMQDWQGFSLTFLKPKSSISTPFPTGKHPEACRASGANDVPPISFAGQKKCETFVE